MVEQPVPMLPVAHALIANLSMPLYPELVLYLNCETPDVVSEPCDGFETIEIPVNLYLFVVKVCPQLPSPVIVPSYVMESFDAGSNLPPLMTHSAFAKTVDEVENARKATTSEIGFMTAPLLYPVTISNFHMISSDAK